MKKTRNLPNQCGDHSPNAGNASPARYKAAMARTDPIWNAIQQVRFLVKIEVSETHLSIAIGINEKLAFSIRPRLCTLSEYQVLFGCLLQEAVSHARRNDQHSSV